MGTGVLSLEVKGPRREVDHSPPSNAEVKNEWSYTSTPPPPYAFKAWTGAAFSYLYHARGTKYILRV